MDRLRASGGAPRQRSLTRPLRRPLIPHQRSGACDEPSTGVQREPQRPTAAPAAAPAEAAAPRPSLWRRWRSWRPVTVVLAVVAVLVVGAAGTAYGIDLRGRLELHDAHSRFDATVSGLAAAVTDGGSVTADARHVVAGATAPDAPADADPQTRYQLTDPSLVGTLASAIAASDAAVAQARAAATTLPAGATLDVIRSATAGLRDLDAAVRAASAQVKAVTKQLSDSHAAWQVQRATASLTAAAAEVSALVPSAQSALDASAGKVQDDAVRTALSAAIDAARTAAGAGPARTLDGLQAQLATLAQVRSDLAARTLAVTQAQADWQHAQDAAAAAAQVAAQTAAQHAASAAAAAASAAAAQPPAPSAPAAAPPAAPAPGTGTSGGGSGGGGSTPPATSPTTPPAVQSVADVIAGLQAARTKAGLRNTTYTAATCTRTTTVTGATYQAILAAQSRSVLSTTANPMAMTGTTTTVNGSPSVKVTLYRCTA